MASDQNLQVTSWAAPAGAWVVVTAGELDLHSSEFLQEHLNVLLQKGVSRLALDLSRVHFMDSTGLKVLLDTRGKADERGGRVVLVDPHPRVLKVLRLAGILEAFPNCASADEALAALSEV